MKIKEGKVNFNVSIKSFFGGRIFFVFLSLFTSLFFFQKDTHAATVTWISTTTKGTWETASKWSGGAVPTSADDVIISSSTFITVTSTLGQTINFSTLTIGGSSASNTLIIAGNIGTGGSITISASGTLQQESTTTQSISGTLTIENRGLLTHTSNTSSQKYAVDFNAQTIDLQSGGSINVDGRGYAGVATGNGQGPGAGVGTSGNTASGAGHGGNGETGGSSIGGVGYCDLTNVNTIGSSGGGGNSTGGNGGGLIRLTSTGTTTINGTIAAQGQGGGANATAGAGAGGGVKIVADVVTGTSTVNISGGTNSSSGINGGGGCAQISFTTLNNFPTSSVTMNGGSGAGGGQLYIKATTATYGDLVSVNGSTSATSTPLLIRNAILNSLSLTRSRFVVTSTNSLSLVEPSGDPFGNSSSTAIGTLYVQGTITLNTNTIDKINFTVDGGSFINSSTLNFLPGISVSFANTTFSQTPFITTSATTTISGTNSSISMITSTQYLVISTSTSGVISMVTSSGALVISSSSVSIDNLVINSSTNIIAFRPNFTSVIINANTTTLSNYSTTSPLNAISFIMNGGTLLHPANTTAQSHIIFVSSTEINIGSTARVNADSRGYSGGAAGGGDGQGPGGGYGTNYAGGAGAGTHATYCDITNVSTIGSGGGSGNGANEVTRAAGGGLIILKSTATTTINGTISASATGTNGNAYSGGGSGGGIKIVGRVVTGTPATNLNATGQFSSWSQGGGGGCVQISYSLSNSITTSSINGGRTSLGSVGSVGLFSTTVVPTTTPSPMTTPTQVNATTVNVTTTITDVDQQVTSLIVQYSTNGGTTWASSTIGTVTASVGTVSTSSGQISNIGTDSTGSVTLTIPWLIGTDIPGIVTTTAKIRLIPNDGASNGATNTSANFSLDTKKPTMPGNLTVFLIASSSVRLTFPSVTSTDTNFTDYRIFYSTSTPVTNTLNTVITSSTDANLGSTTFSDATSTLITGLSNATLYYFNLYAYDRWGFNTSSLIEASTTTGPGSLTPYDVTTNLDSGTQITVTWSGNTPEYYVENTTAGTNSGWISATTYTFTNLGCGTNFSFKVKARAADLTETGFSSSVTAASTANCPSGGGSSGGGGSYTPPPTPTTTPSPTNTPTPNPTDPTNTTQPEDPELLANRIERIKQYCPNLKPGDEFKVVGKPAIFILGNDYRPRYFPNGNVYKTYKLTYGGYIKVSQECITLAMDPPTTMPTAINPRPGSVLLTFGTATTTLYAVLPNNTVAPITTQSATALYGSRPYILNLSERDKSQFTTVAPAITEPKVHPGMTITITEEGSTVYYVDAQNKLREVRPSTMETNFFLEKFVYPVSQVSVVGLEKGGGVEDVGR